MKSKASGQLRRSQVISTYGPGSLIELPRHSAIVGGLDTWPNPTVLDEIQEPRLSHKIQIMTGVAAPRLYAPPPAPDHLGAPARNIGAWLFPEWFVVQEADAGGEQRRSRRLVHRKALDARRRFEGRPVIATRFVRACARGHVDDLDWRGFVHRASRPDCFGQLWLDEHGTSGDFSELSVRCSCGVTRSLGEASLQDVTALGICRGTRPWLGNNSSEECDQPSRLIVRTASNAYFPQIVTVLSLPDRARAVDGVVGELWDDLSIVADATDLTFLKRKPAVAARLAAFADGDVLQAIEDRKHGGADERPVKQAELDAILAVAEGFGDDVPIDPDFHARRLPDRIWRHSERYAGIEAVFQLHRLREVMALIGFSRLEAVTPDIQGEFDSDVQRAAIAIDPTWFPAVENRGEGVFLQLDPAAVRQWRAREAVERRLESLSLGHRLWTERRKTKKPFPGGPYILLHTLSHLLIDALAMQSGYPASSIRERIYADEEGERYGILLYTASPDAEGTLGGLVQQARHIEDHLAQALRSASLCSNDPICSQHHPDTSLEERWLQGAACHGCALLAETSCEMRNDYLDRALVVPVLGLAAAAFFTAGP